MAWGHKVVVYLYFEGEPSDGRVQDVIESEVAQNPDAHFIGVEIQTVDDEPREQGA